MLYEMRLDPCMSEVFYMSQNLEYLPKGAEKQTHPQMRGVYYK